MKKLLPILLSLLLLAACAAEPSISGSLPKGTSETVQEPEKAPAGTTETAPEKPTADPEEKPSGSDAAEPEAEQPEDTPEEVSEEKDPPKEAQPEETDTTTIRVYYGNDNADALLCKEVVLAEITPDAVVSELIAVDILPEGTLVNRLELIGAYLYLDLSYEFFARMQTTGTAGEWIIVSSVTNTFLDAYDANALILTANGAIIETGHNVYDFPLTFVS